MDSEFDSLDDFVAPPADEGASKKFKPKAKGRSKACTNAVPSTSSNVLKEKDVNSNPALVETVRENSTDVTNSGCDADALNNSDEPQLRASVYQGDSVSAEPLISQEDESANPQWDPFDDIDLGQSVNIARSDGKFRPKLKSCPEKQTLNSVASGLSGAGEQSRVEICSDGTDFSGNIEGSLDDVLVQFDFTTDEGFQPQSRSSPGKSLNTNEEAFLGDMIIQSYQCDTGEVPFTDVTVEHENPHPSFVNPELNMCDSSHDQAMCRVIEPRNCRAFSSELLDSPSIFPAADDYFSINAHSVDGSEIGRSGTFVRDDDMHMHGETAHEIPSERADEFAPAEDTRTRQSSRVLRKSKTRSAQPSELVEGENDGLHDGLLSDTALSQDVCEDNNEEDTDFKRKGVKRSRKYAPDNVEQKRSRKKVNDTSSEQNEKPKKKFSRSTKQKRKPDPELLAAIAVPADEFDYKRYPFKVLIGVANHNERESKKVTTPSNTHATNQRIESPSPWDEPRCELNENDICHNEEDNYSNQDGGNDDKHDGVFSASLFQ